MIKFKTLLHTLLLIQNQLINLAVLYHRNFHAKIYNTMKLIKVIAVNILIFIN